MENMPIMSDLFHEIVASFQQRTTKSKRHLYAIYCYDKRAQPLSQDTSFTHGLTLAVFYNTLDTTASQLWAGTFLQCIACAILFMYGGYIRIYLPALAGGEMPIMSKLRNE